MMPSPDLAQRMTKVPLCCILSFFKVIGFDGTFWAIDHSPPSVQAMLSYSTFQKPIIQPLIPFKRMYPSYSSGNTTLKPHSYDSYMSATFQPSKLFMDYLFFSKCCPCVFSHTLSRLSTIKAAGPGVSKALKHMLN